jgi:hypothetical protein
MVVVGFRNISWSGLKLDHPSESRLQARDHFMPQDSTARQFIRLRLPEMPGGPRLKFYVNSELLHTQISPEHPAKWCLLKCML